MHRIIQCLSGRQEGTEGLTENDGHENDGPSKLHGMKLQDVLDVKMTDRFAQHEIAGHEIARQENAGHENDGPKMTAGRELAGEQTEF